MKTAVFLCVQMLNYLSFAAALFYFAIDFRSGQSKLWLSVLILLLITDMVLTKIYGQESETFLDGKFAQLVINLLLLVLVLVMYWQVEPSVSYLLIFGVHLIQKIIEAMKMNDENVQDGGML